MFDLSYLNNYIIKPSVKYEDLKTVLELLEECFFCVCVCVYVCVFSFDLKSAYHHIDIFKEHRKYFTFKWEFEDRTTNLFQFRVLVFGLTSAPYVFTKVMRQIVKYWRRRSIRVVVYLDDGIGDAKGPDLLLQHSNIIKRTLLAAGCTPNESKSVWILTQYLCWQGWELNFKIGTITILDKKLKKIKS